MYVLVLGLWIDEDHFFETISCSRLNLLGFKGWSRPVFSNIPTEIFILMIKSTPQEYIFQRGQLLP